MRGMAATLTATVILRWFSERYTCVYRCLTATISAGPARQISASAPAWFGSLTAITPA